MIVLDRTCGYTGIMIDDSSQILIKPSTLTPEEVELRQLLQSYREASEDAVPASPDEREASQKRLDFLEKFLDFRERVMELRLALRALQDHNAKHPPKQADVALFEHYLQTLTEKFINDCKTAQKA